MTDEGVKLSQKAIQAAMAANWEEAQELNLQILKDNPEDIGALNRLGRAYFEQGQKEKATKAFQKALKINPYNTIAQKNLDLLKTFKGSKGNRVVVFPDLFIEEPGKTKTVSLTKIADKKTFSTLSVGEEVQLKAKKHSLSCYDPNGIYLGRLPDDLSSRLVKLINGGNLYQAFIRSLNFPEIKIFIKEIKQTRRFEDVPSFPTKNELSYLPFMPPELIHGEQPTFSSPEEEEEINL